MAFGKCAVGFGERAVASCHAKVTAVCLKTYYKLTGGRSKPFTFSRGAARKKNVLAAWEASLKRGRSCGIPERAPRKGHHRPPHKGHLHPPRKGKVLMLRIVQFVNGLRPSTGLS